MNLKRLITKGARLCWHLLALIGLGTCLVGIYGLYRAMNHYDLTWSQLAVEATRKLGIETPLLTKVLTPRPRFTNQAFAGTLTRSHPRILYSASTLREVRDLYRSNPEYARLCESTCRGKGLLWQTACWATASNQEAGAKAIEQLVAMVPDEPNASGSYGNGLEMALAYDLLYHHPAMTVTRHQQIQLKLEDMVRRYLVVLDGDSASLWHGRTSLAACAWITALGLDESSQTSRELLARVQAHFLDVLHALEITEGWPEGYNYWINNRAFPLVLACLGHMNAVQAPEINGRVKRLLERAGYWHIYGTRPIGGFELFGDSGPRVDLKDETQRVIDLIYLGTSNPVFTIYSAYLKALHRQEGYYHGYRWGVPLFQFKTLSDPLESKPPTGLRMFNGALPKSMAFGRDSWGQVYIRSDWGGSEATFITYRAGNTFTHHGHYDSGHFTLFKGAPLAITSGTYGDYTSPHRLNYAIRTVSKNGILVLRPGEKVQPNRFFKHNVADGGQRIVMPTGSAVTSVVDWNENLGRGRHFEGGKIVAYENAEPDFVYINSDLTRAYNSKYYDDIGEKGKVSLVKRQMVYLFAEDALVVYDEVESTKADYVKKWLLHCWNKPETIHERVLVGGIDNGILQSNDSAAVIRNGKGRLTVERLLPKDGILRKIGGPDYRYYVETDGDETRLDGVNFTEGAKERPWFDAGMWRLELQSQVPKTQDHFLVVLKPSLGEVSWLPSLLIQAADGMEAGAVVGKTLVVFRGGSGHSKTLKYHIPAKRVQRHVIVDLPPNQPVTVRIGNAIQRYRASQEGTLRFNDPLSESHEVTVEIGK
ncbi:MAG: hypothetical protein QME44_10020 [Thermodesulfobacteriota bacterium]|nr:hypothetical protein [Thermodesulfobacteriota bacterium]